MFQEITSRSELRVWVFGADVPEHGVAPGTHLSVEIFGVGSHRYGGMSHWLSREGATQLRDALAKWLSESGPEGA